MQLDDVHSLLIFFFQAEDGIRDIGVTGVQTCALPICVLPAVSRIRARRAGVELWLREAAAQGLDWDRRLEIGSQSEWREAIADRKSGVEGKRVDFGGGRITKQKRTTCNSYGTSVHK